MHDSHYHKDQSTEMFVDYPGTQFDCPVCHPERKAARKPVPVTEPVVVDTQPNITKHATFVPNVRKGKR